MPTPRQQLATWLRDAIADLDSVDLPALTDQAVAHFADDVPFLQAWAADTLRPVAYTIGTQIAAQTRTPLAPTPAPTTGAAPPPPAPPRWLARLEHVGDRYVRLGAMDQSTLVAWATERRRRGESELHLAGLGEHLAERLPAGQTVAQTFSDEQIDRWARLLAVNATVSIPVPTPTRRPSTRKEEAAD